MSVITLILLPAAAAAVALGAAALHTTRGLRRQVAALHTELAAARTDAAAAGRAGIPAARTSSATETPLADIRAAVADALAEERERELAEARAFWAAQEARDAADAPSLLGGLTGLGEEGPADARAEQREPAERLEVERLDVQPFLPRQADLAGLEPLLGPDALEPFDALESVEALDAPELEHVEETESAELAAARRRHPSHPDFSPSPVISDHERTVARLEELAQQSVPLADVRPGPLGTLDVYVFADGTTLCLTPGDRATADRIAGALGAGHTPVLLGGSGISGAYALTFSWGESHQESVYILADRVIASL
ncbi:hypothetical protein ACIRPT_09825 [Streptomyces sp. NPDC101227]|uniref:hypothetical protein n=1 Tax=Streptomyces sp. NPDC101227 TaxID=3366136 RepID=UPI003810AC8E